jgi:hypothetical protein
MNANEESQLEFISDLIRVDSRLCAATFTGYQFY